MKTKSNQSKIDCLRSNHSYLDYSELDHSQLNHSMMVNTSSIVLGGLMGITLLSGLILSSSLASADDAVDVVTITVPTSCSMSSTGTNSHTAEISNGQTNSAVGESTIKAYCNDNNGFSIYAIGYTDDELGKTVLTSSTLGSTHDILTGTNTTGNSSWAMKLSTITSPEPTYPLIIAGSVADTDKEQGDPDYTSFQEVPDDYTLVAKRTSSTDTGENAEGATLKTTYQVHISNTQSAGTYTGQVKYTMVHPYMQDDSNKPTTAFIMQNVSQWGSSITAGQEVTAIDSRDGKSYTVAKLADGNIWMTQNLDHDIKTDGTVTYDSTTTDISSAWSPSTATYASSNTTWNGLYTAPESYDPGDLCWNGTLDSNWSTTLSNGTTACGNDKHYHIGNYYSWTAAVVMNDSSSFTTQNTDVDQSICPAGWRLPIGGYNDTGPKSFRYLVNQLSLTSGTSGNIQSSPVYFVYGGGWHGSSYYVGSVDHYWSSVVYSSYGAYSLYFGADGYLDPQDYDHRTNGNSVRCVAR